MKKLLVASNNQHKIKEIKEILKDRPVEVVSLKESGIDIDVEETGTSFMENAYIKAKAIYDLLDNKEDYLVMSDDSGLEVDALDRSTGIILPDLLETMVIQRKTMKSSLLALKG